MNAGERNDALQPVAAAERVFRFRDHAALWFSLGVGLLVMQTGAYLVPAAGMRDALVAVLVGSAVGAGLLAWTARIGCATGLSSAGLMHRTFGRGFARLPVLLNIVQLVGWTTFELVVMRDGTLAIIRHASGLALPGFSGVLASTLAWGGVLVLLLAGSMVKLVRRVISRVGLPLVVMSLAWLTWQFGSRLADAGLAAMWSRPGDGRMGLFAALDLVIAMPVSWLPLVSDYARHGRLDNGRGPGKAFFGTWLGYVVANIWCYGLGVVVVGSAAHDADMLGTLLLAQGGLLALGLILVDELDNAYGDVYSGSVSANSIWSRWSVRRWGLGLAMACTLLALVLPMHGLEPFLLWLSSVFVPLYGVILGRLGNAGVLDDGSRVPRRIDVIAAMLWVGGIVFYHVLVLWAPNWGSALPTLVVTFVAGRLTRPSPATNGACGGSAPT